MTAPLRAHRSPVSAFLADTTLAPRQAYKSLTLWPLVLRPGAGEPVAPPYVALADAIEAGTLRVDEVGLGGSVPHVGVENTGETAVLVLFGEEILGAKQNRIANASFLVGPQSHVVLDVSCVEHGRWSRSPGARFAPSREVVSPSLRRRMASQVSASLDLGGGFAADQADVWHEVSARLAHARADSSTGAYADYRRSRTSDLAAFAGAFHPIDGQVGFVASIGDTVVGLELVGRAEVFARVFPGLVRAYAIDAVDAELVRTHEPERAMAPGFDGPEPFLRALADAPVTTAPSLGLGEDLRLAAGGIAGCALAAGEVVHLTAFPSEPA